MKERPIIFSPEIVRAMLAGNVTQTRRVVKFMHETPKLIGQAAEHRNLNAVYPAREKGWVFWQTTRAGDGLAEFTKKAYATGLLCPYGEPGDRLWVRETCAIGFTDSGELACDYFADGKRKYFERTIYNDADRGWMIYINDGKRPSIFMPRWASRITLEIVNVRVERLQDISDDDAKAEGFEYYGETLFKDYGEILAEHTAIYKYASYWDLLNARQGFLWKSNPWVWVIGFRVLEPASCQWSVGSGEG